MKKRQQDFQKVKLKVGKTLPKGRNETKTSFDSKKINLIKQQLRVPEDKQTLKELLSFMKSTDVKMKVTNLQKIKVYVSDNKDKLSMFFPDILKELGRTFQESDPHVRSEAISVLDLCAEILTDIQLKSFVAPLTSYLNCMMTHINSGVQKDSLKLLDVLLNSHCSVICQSYEILFYLLNMISCKVSCGKKWNKKNKEERKLIDKISSKISADDWRLLVLKQMLTFLNGITAEMNSTAMETDDKKVYWDAKEALYLPLYLNSGVEPAKFDYSLYCSVKSEECDLKQFIKELTCVLFAILKSFSINKSLSDASIKCLHVVTQILCCVGEWTSQNLDSEWNPVQRLINIYNQLEKGFPYSQQAKKSVNGDEVNCDQLNLGICYYYCLCSLLAENPEELGDDSWDVVKRYLASVLSNSGLKMNEKSISLTLKISRIVMEVKSFNESDKNGILIALLGTLDSNKMLPVANDLYSFFMDLSLNYDYKYLHTTQAMKTFFQSLIPNLIFMIESQTLATNYLNFIEQVCLRKYPPFMEMLNKLTSEKLIKILKCGDEDTQCTIIHLIVSLDKIYPDFLQDLAENIRDRSFSLKTASRLIRRLHSRFSKSGVPPIDQMNFVKFLLNLGCDTFLILDPSRDGEPLPLTETLIQAQRMFACRCQIYSTPHFERHRDIFEVCAECLSFYLKEEIHANQTAFFIRAIFSEHIGYPVHSVVAFIELFRRFGILANDSQLVQFLQNFVYSCLLYNSFMIKEEIPTDHLAEYCIEAVQDCLLHIDPMEIISYMGSNLHIFEEDQIIHVMKILMFLMRRRFFDVLNKNCLFLFLAKLHELEAFPKDYHYKVMLDNMREYLHNQ